MDICNGLHYKYELHKHSVYPLLILLSVDGQLAVMNNASLHICVQVFVFSFLFGVYLGVDLLGHVVYSVFTNSIKKNKILENKSNKSSAKLYAENYKHC